MNQSVKKNTWKEVFKGFELRQTLRIEFPIDSKKTSLVLLALGKAWPDLEVDNYPSWSPLEGDGSPVWECPIP
ncbi:MAG: hypothetical protein MJZ25_08305 [Fibrobacter sp.]|nr:hypothetical protein [Fibrobacter sp.]